MKVPTTNYDTDQIATELGNVSTAGAYSSDDLFDSSEIDDFDVMPSASNAADLKTEPNDTDKFRGYVNFRPAYILGKYIDNVLGNYKLPGSDWPVSSYSYAHANVFAYDDVNKILCWGTTTSNGNNVLPMWKVSNNYNTREIVIVENTGFAYTTSCVKFVNGYLFVCSHIEGANKSLRINYCPMQSDLNGYDNIYNWKCVTYPGLGGVSGPITDIMYYNGRYYYTSIHGEVGSLNSSFSDGKQHLDVSRTFTKCSILGTRFIAWAEDNGKSVWCYLSSLPTSGGGDFSSFEAAPTLASPVLSVIEANGYNYVLFGNGHLYRVASVSSSGILISNNCRAIGYQDGYLLVLYGNGQLYLTGWFGEGGTNLGSLASAYYGYTIFKY